MRTLVIYYSRSGNTKRIAEQVATALGADLEAIADPTVRSGLRGYQRSGFQAFFHRTVDIGPVARDPASYDLVVVGTPIWNVSLSSPVRSYLRRYRASLPAVAFFCTCGGMGMARVFAQMARESRQQPKATLVVREAELATAASAIERFARDLRGGPAATGAPGPVAQPSAATH